MLGNRGKLLLTSVKQPMEDDAGHAGGGRHGEVERAGTGEAEDRGYRRYVKGDAHRGEHRPPRSRTPG